MFLPYVAPSKEQLIQVIQDPSGPASFKEISGSPSILYKVLDVSSLKAFKPFVEYLESPYFITGANYDARLQTITISASVDVGSELNYRDAEMVRHTVLVASTTTPKISLSVTLLAMDIVPKNSKVQDTLAHKLEKFLRSVRRSAYMVSASELDSSSRELLEVLRAADTGTSYTQEDLIKEIREGRFLLGLDIKGTQFLVEVTSVTAAKAVDTPYVKTMNFGGIVESYTLATIIAGG